MVMATKKKFNPLAAAITIAAIGATGFLVWNFIIKPRRKKKEQDISDLIASYPKEVLDAQFEIVDDQQA
jgi:hypothetical protein